MTFEDEDKGSSRSLKDVIWSEGTISVELTDSISMPTRENVYVCTGSSRHCGAFGFANGLHIQCNNGGPAADQIIHVPAAYVKLPASLRQRAVAIPSEQSDGLIRAAWLQGMVCKYCQQAKNVAPKAIE